MFVRRGDCLLQCCLSPLPRVRIMMSVHCVCAREYLTISLHHARVCLHTTETLQYVFIINLSIFVERLNFAHWEIAIVTNYHQRFSVVWCGNERARISTFILYDIEHHAANMRVFVQTMMGMMFEMCTARSYSQFAYLRNVRAVVIEFWNNSTTYARWPTKQ